MNAGLANFCCCFIDCSELTYLEENHQEKNAYLDCLFIRHFDIRFDQINHFIFIS